MLIALLVALLPPVDHPWAGCQPGTFVRYRLTREPAEKGGPAGQKISVLEARDDQVLLRIESLGAAGELVFQEETRHRFSAPPERRRGGRETLRIDGREYACEVWESESGKTKTRVWLQPELGRAPLQTEDKTGETTRVSRVVRFRETRSAAGQDFVCRVVERVERGGNRPPITTRTWECLEVPGHLVREEVRTDAPGRPRLAVRELTDLQVRKVSPVR